MSFLRKKSLQRFYKYSVIGVSTFVLDLLLLWILTDILHIYHVFSAGIGFLAAVSLNYHLVRQYVFVGTERSVRDGYIIFMTITGLGLLFIMGLMYVFVEIFGLHYITSRVLIASVVGCWNYFMNLYFNFRVAGK